MLLHHFAGVIIDLFPVARLAINYQRYSHLLYLDLSVDSGLHQPLTLLTPLEVVWHIYECTINIATSSQQEKRKIYATLQNDRLSLSF